MGQIRLLFWLLSNKYAPTMKGLGSKSRNSLWQAASVAAAGLLLTLLTVALVRSPWRGKPQHLRLAARGTAHQAGTAPQLGAATPALLALRNDLGNGTGAAALCRLPAKAKQSPSLGTIAPAVYENIAEPPAQAAPPPTTEHFQLRRAITILALLREVGLNSTQWSTWEKAFRATAHSVVLRPGHLVELDKEPGGQLRGLRYDLDDSSSVVERSLGGVVVAARKPLTYLPHTVTCSLALQPNLTGARNRLPSTIIDRLANIFGARLHAGAFLKLVYSEFVTADGTHTKDADLKAADIKTGHQELQAFSFRDQHGNEHLYDAKGRQLGPQFLRYPVKFKYISSTFSAARYHPILHVYRPHVGVDLAAGYGTPVKAAGDGVVEFAGWAGELGRCVRIKHNNGLTSVYGHLSGISSAARPGAAVRIGQVIGWVGASGLATGPHLHYALYEEGHFLNPLTVKLDQAASIPSNRMALFNEFKNRWDGELAKLPNANMPPATLAAEQLPGRVADRVTHPDLPLTIAKPVDPGMLTASATTPVHLRHHRYRYRHHVRHRRASAAALDNDSASM